MKPQTLPAASYRFRCKLLDALERRGPIGYKTCDSIDALCPICSGILIVHFAGTAPRAELVCDRGCDERDIFTALGRLAPKGAA